jgi:hypothetical protein
MSFSCMIYGFSKFDTDTTEWCFAYSRLISVPYAVYG